MLSRFLNFENHVSWCISPSCIIKSKNESGIGSWIDSCVMNRFFFNKTSHQKAKMNRFTVLESQNRLSTSLHHVSGRIFARSHSPLQVVSCFRTEQTNILSVSLSLGLQTFRNRFCSLFCSAHLWKTNSINRWFGRQGAGAGAGGEGRTKQLLKPHSRM